MSQKLFADPVRKADALKSVIAKRQMSEARLREAEDSFEDMIETRELREAIREQDMGPQLAVSRKLQMLNARAAHGEKYVLDSSNRIVKKVLPTKKQAMDMGVVEMMRDGNDVPF